jgi:hypothetical protein
MYKYFFGDMLIIIFVVLIIITPYIPIFNGIEVFDLWSYMLFSGIFGAYIMLRVVYKMQYYNAKRIGMTYELDRINKGKVKQ